MKRAHDLVVSAIVVEEEETSAIAKPFYLVQELVPNLRWPDGGVVLYGLSLFLLDLSWQQSGSWICFCLLGGGCFFGRRTCHGRGSGARD